MRSMTWLAVTGGLLIGGPGGCSADSDSTPASLGKPCVTIDELDANFEGYSVRDVNIELDSPACGGGNAVCLVNHFQGRVSCPYGQGVEGQSLATDNCYVAHSDEKVQVTVRPQLLKRQPDVAVYCSCRCAGPDEAADYCACAPGFACLELVATPDAPGEAKGSYCVKKSSEVIDVDEFVLDECKSDEAKSQSICGDGRPFPAEG